MTGMDVAKARIAEIGRQMSPDIMEEMRTLFRPLLRPIDPSVRIVRDLAYGEDARHRLNLFIPDDAAGAPVVIFVHGGGFVTGDKGDASDGFYDNVGLWAARSGCVGVTINYRLAPAHGWPAGRDDTAAAVRWIAENIGGHGGNSGRVFLMGHSAGAAHVAAAVGQAETAALLAGCICLSGLYDMSIAPVNPAYFGEPELHAQRSPLEGLAAAPLPLFCAVAEYDPPVIQKHSVSLWRARLDRTSNLPRIFQISGQNHFSATYHLNTADEALGDAITGFIASI